MSDSKEIIKKDSPSPFKDNPDNRNKSKKKIRIIKISFIILFVSLILITFVVCIYYFVIKKKKQLNLNNNDLNNNNNSSNNNINDIIPNNNDLNYYNNENNKCLSGFYLPNDISENPSCKKCSIENCENCYGNSQYDICTSCLSSFIPIYENNIIKSCSPHCKVEDFDNCLICDDITNKCSKCKTGYILIKDKCILSLDYSFKAVYKTTQKDEIINIIQSNYVESITEMKIENNNIIPRYNYSFPDIGLHTIYVLLKENISNFTEMFSWNQNLVEISFAPLFYTENITDISLMFNFCMNLSSADLYYFNTQNLQRMSSLFYGCFSLTSVNISSFNTENVVYMSSLFSCCYSLTSMNLSHFKTNNTIRMAFLFSDCYNLKYVDISNFNTENVHSLAGFFDNCISLESINLAHFNTNNVEYIYHMFNNCSSLTSLDIHNFNTQNVIDMENIFAHCSKLKYLDISLFRFNESHEDYGYDGIFDGLPSSGTLKINIDFYNIMKEIIPNNWIIDTD